MRTFLTIVILGTLTLTSACQDRSNIKVTGQIKDRLTGDPIPNARVVILCWYAHNVDDASFKKETLTTDNSGKFTAKFDKGHEVDVAAQADGFLPAKGYYKLESSEIKLRLELNQTKKNGSLVSRLMTETDMISVTDKTPFLRLRTQNEKTVTYGFDFATLTTKTDTSNCDIWFRIDKTPTTLVAHNSGGLVPILNSDIRSSLLFEMEQAPTTGYKSNYFLKGEEEGFFVRCRDGRTYAKIILTKGTIDVRGPINGGTFKEQGKYFSYFYQPNGTTDLAFSKEEIDLEKFLIDFKYK